LGNVLEGLQSSIHAIGRGGGGGGAGGVEVGCDGGDFATFTSNRE